MSCNLQNKMYKYIFPLLNMWGYLELISLFRFVICVYKTYTFIDKSQEYTVSTCDVYTKPIIV